ncbi:MAG: hypothetical protein RLZZ352_2820, partial [Pseudomonadota bacterium]
AAAAVQFNRVHPPRMTRLALAGFVGAADKRLVLGFTQTMSELLDQLNRNSGGLSALFSGVVTVATVVYAWLTAKLVDETRKLRQVQTEPRIQITYRTRPEWINLLDIAVKNIGQGPAEDLRFTIKAVSANSAAEPLVQSLKALNAFGGGIKYLGPQQEFASFWTSLMDGDESKVESRIQIECAYKSVTGTPYRVEHVLDLAELKGSSQIGEPPLLKIAKHLEKMQSDLHQLATGFRRLGVNTYDSEDRASERAEVQQRIREHEERTKPSAGEPPT